MEKIINFFRDEDGATAAEYAIMVSLIAGVIILTVAFFGFQIEGVFNEAGSLFNEELNN